MVSLPSYKPAQGLRTSLDDFTDYVNHAHRLNITSYAQLHDFSVNRLNDFWMSFWDFAGIIASQRPTRALDESIPIHQFPKFFKDARLNFAENLLTRHASGPAIISTDEDTLLSPVHYSWPELRELVRQYASALRGSGFRVGDIVAVVGGNRVKSLALQLATAALGGVFSSFSTDIGDKTLIDRLGLLMPQFLFVESIYSYNGKIYNIISKINSVILRLGSSCAPQLIVSGPIPGIEVECLTFESFLARDTGSALEFEQVPFNTPFVVMFSSGTTGLPKGIVHSHGGLVANGLREALLQDSLTPKDVVFQYTSIGWALWNISISSLFTGTPLVLYEGSPFYPSPEKFLRAIFAQKVTCFGAGPRYYSELQKLNIQPKNFAPYLHSIMSAGAVLTSSLAEWIASAFGPVCQISKCGGTELAGAFLHGTRSLPSYPGQISVKVLGMDIAVYDSDGQPLADGVSGELVCRKPFPNMPTHFLADPANKRYFAAYFSQIPQVWTQGDFVKVDKDTGGFYVLGRSDGVLNPSGVRFGSSEIYAILAKPQFTASIVDSLVVGQQRVDSRYSDSAEKVVLFVKCSARASSGKVLPRAQLIDAIRSQISKDLSRRHVPAYIFEVDEIPYNANGKKLEIPVKKVLCEGDYVLSKLKVNQEELRQVAKFVPFYQIEQLLEGSEKLSARL